jgi:hypothetical protein
VATLSDEDGLPLRRYFKSSFSISSQSGNPDLLLTAIHTRPVDVSKRNVSARLIVLMKIWYRPGSTLPPAHAGRGFVWGGDWSCAAAGPATQAQAAKVSTIGLFNIFTCRILNRLALCSTQTILGIKACRMKLILKVVTDLTVLGLLLTLLGGAIGAWGVWLTPHEAVEIGVSRWNGDIEEQNLQLPGVQNLLRESRTAAIGFVTICVGTGLQILGTLKKTG